MLHWQKANLAFLESRDPTRDDVAEEDASFQYLSY